VAGLELTEFLGSSEEHEAGSPDRGGGTFGGGRQQLRESLHQGSAGGDAPRDMLIDADKRKIIEGLTPGQMAKMERNPLCRSYEASVRRAHIQSPQFAGFVGADRLRTTPAAPSDLGTGIPPTQ
jgi:hypothetical protein